MPTSSAKRRETIRRQRRELARGLGAKGELLKGSLIERFTVCTRPGCRCAKGHKHGPYLYASFFDGKQSRQVYVPKSMEGEVRRWVRNYQTLTQKVTKLSELSVELIRMAHRKTPDNRR